MKACILVGLTLLGFRINGNPKLPFFKERQLGGAGS